MNKYQSIKLCGLLMIINGLFLLASPFIPSMAIQYTVTLFMITSSAFAWLTTFKSRHIQLPFKYHELHAIGIVVYSLAILFFSTTVAKFINITTCFFIYYGTAELIFCFQLLNQRAKLSMQVILLRSFMAISIYIGAVFIMNFSGAHQNTSLQVCGIMFIVSGINMFLYNAILHKLEIATNSSRTI